MENLTGGTPPVRYLPCVVPCKLYFLSVIITNNFSRRYPYLCLINLIKNLINNMLIRF